MQESGKRGDHPLITDGDREDSRPEEAAPPSVHPLWHVALVLAGGLALGAWLIDPATGGDDRNIAQLRIARVGLFVLAAGLVGLWALRRSLEADIRTAIQRWHDAPSPLSPGDVVPGFRSRAAGVVAWGAALLWFGAVGIGLGLHARWPYHLTFENGPLETLTVLGYLGGFLLSLRALWLVARERSASGRPRRWFLVLGALGCFLIAAEETDWGQTYLRYETPETFDEVNIQGDLSLHNLALPEAVGVTRWANWGLRLIAWTLGGGVALLILVSGAFRRLMWALDVPVPPWWSMAVLFAAAWIPEIEGVYDRNNVGSELREVTIAVAVAVWMWTAWRDTRCQGGPQRPPG